MSDHAFAQSRSRATPQRTPPAPQKKSNPRGNQAQQAQQPDTEAQADTFLSALMEEPSFADAEHPDTRTTDLGDTGFTTVFDGKTPSQVTLPDGRTQTLGEGWLQSGEGFAKNPGGSNPIVERFDPRTGERSRDAYQGYGTDTRRMKLAGVEKDGKQWRLKHDVLDGLTAIRNPDGSVRRLQNTTLDGHDLVRNKRHKNGSTTYREDFTTGERSRIEYDTNKQLQSVKTATGTFRFEYGEDGNPTHMTDAAGTRSELPRGTVVSETGLAFTQDETVDGQTRGVTNTLNFRSGETTQFDAAKAAHAKFEQQAHGDDHRRTLAAEQLRQGNTWAMDMLQQHNARTQAEGGWVDKDKLRRVQDTARLEFQKSSDPVLRKKLAPYVLSQDRRISDEFHGDTAVEAFSLTLDSAAEGNQAALDNLTLFVDAGGGYDKPHQNLVEHGERALLALAYGGQGSKLVDTLRARESSRSERFDKKNPELLRIRGAAASTLDAADPRRKETVADLRRIIDTPRRDGEAYEAKLNSQDTVAAMKGLGDLAPDLSAGDAASVARVAATSDPKTSLAAMDTFVKSLDNFDAETRRGLVKGLLDAIPGELQQGKYRDRSNDDLDAAFALKMQALQGDLTSDDYTSLLNGDFTKQAYAADKNESRRVNAFIASQALSSSDTSDAVKKHIFDTLANKDGKGVAHWFDARHGDARGKMELAGVLEYAASQGDEAMVKAAEAFLPKPKPKPVEHIGSTSDYEAQRNTIPLRRTIDNATGDLIDKYAPSFIKKINDWGRNNAFISGVKNGYIGAGDTADEIMATTFMGPRNDKQIGHDKFYDPNTNEVLTRTQEIETDGAEFGQRVGEATTRRNSVSEEFAELRGMSSAEKLEELATRAESSRQVRETMGQLFASGEEFAAEQDYNVRQGGMFANAAFEGIAGKVSHEATKGMLDDVLKKAATEGGIDGVKKFLQDSAKVHIQGTTQEVLPTSAEGLNWEADMLREIAKKPLAAKLTGHPELAPVVNFVLGSGQRAANGKLAITPGTILKSGGDAVSDLASQYFGPGIGDAVSSFVKDGIVTPLASIADFGAGQGLGVMNAENAAREQTLRTGAIDGPIMEKRLTEILEKNQKLPE